MSRTTSTLVTAVLGDDYDGSRDLTPFIDTASSFVDQVIACAARRKKTITTSQAELVERWLSAHLYQQSDPGYQSRTTGGASAGFTGQTSALGIEGTRYGQVAVRVDPSGCLDIIDKTKVAGGVWLGKPVSEQTPYDQRD